MILAGNETSDQPPPILPYGTVPKGPLRKPILITLLALVILPASAVLLRLAIYVIYPSVPFRYMTVRHHDIGPMACIETPQFILQYEGQSLGPEIDTPPNVPVDGRNARIDALWRQQLYLLVSMSGRAWFTYSQRDRTLTFEYANKRFVYSDPTRRLSVDGRAYSTANGPITLLVKRDGTIVEQESTTSSAK